MSVQATPVKTRGGLQRLSALVSYLPLTGFLIDFAIRLAVGVDDWKQAALDAAVLWLIGTGGIILGLPHLLRPAPVAAQIGWPTSPFQWEVGLASVGFGVLGVTAWMFDRDYTLAAIIVYSIFMVGAALGHVRSMIRERNFAPGNAGFIFWYDIGAPALLISFYAATG
jgi:hypothetical protein